MLCFLNAGHVTVGTVTLDRLRAVSLFSVVHRAKRETRWENDWVGFTPGFDRFHVCSYTAINSPRGKKKLEPGIAGKRHCKQRQIVAHESKVRV